ncbi:MAG: hypothetical protein LBB18_03390 [Puniceicoccales bacterium]|nr:hypothetical protein [Puniceicoccales bacterium]
MITQAIDTSQIKVVEKSFDSENPVDVKQTMLLALQKAENVLLPSSSSSSSSSAATSQLQLVQQQWRNIAHASASLCINSDGTVNFVQAAALQKFWNELSLVEDNKEDNKIPGIELIQEQTLAVLEKLLPKTPDAGTSSNPSPLAQKLDEARLKAPSENGSKILQAMVPPPTAGDSQIPVAILQSLFTPHRQMSLPTCSINALINAEIFNHPEILANIYAQILTTEANASITMPASTAEQMQLQNITPNSPNAAFVTVTPKQSGDNLKNVFGIENKNLEENEELEENKKLWQNEGIEYVPASSSSDSSSSSSSPSSAQAHSLQIPIHDLNDVFFANFMQQIYKDTDQEQVFVQVRQLYFGVPGDKLDFTNAVTKGKQTFESDDETQSEKQESSMFTLTDVNKLKDKARQQYDAGIRYAYVTVFTQGKKATKTAELDPYGGHLENLDLKKLSEIDFDNMENGKCCIIGDRNYVDSNTRKIPYLGLEKVEGNFIPCMIEYNNSVPIILEWAHNLSLNWIGFYQ